MAKRNEYFEQLKAVAEAQRIAKEQQPYDEFMRELLEEITNQLIVEAFANVNIRPFLPNDQRSQSVNTNKIFPIHTGQSIVDAVTLSERHLTAQMIELLKPNKLTQRSGKVLEIGTGSGYLAAVLSHLYATVHTIELKPAIAQRANRTLRDEGFLLSSNKKRGVTVHIGDGALGLFSHQPYNAIIFTAAIKEIPQALIDQLKPGGRLVAPVGAESFSKASIIVVHKKTDGSIERTVHQDVHFLPVISTAEHGWTSEEAVELADSEQKTNRLWVLIPHELLGLSTTEDSEETNEDVQLERRMDVIKHVATLSTETLANCTNYICAQLAKTTKELAEHLVERGILSEDNDDPTQEGSLYRIIVLVNALQGWPIQWATEAKLDTE